MALDIPREASQDPAVHRKLVVVDPPMEGRDVANLQRAVRARLTARELDDDVPTPVHGKFTYASWAAAVEAGYFIGLLSATYLAKDDGRGVCTEGAQAYIRNPDSRTDEQLERASARQGQLERGPRYYSDLAKTAGVAIFTEGSGADKALAWAEMQLGTVERPANSNWGPKIQDWIAIAGYSGPVPWCGAFANAAVMAGGVPSGAGWIGYTPAIVSHAKAGIGKWSWHPEGDGHPGDLALFDSPGGDPAVHVGVCKRKITATTYATIEGNTSSGSGGSQANGGGVFSRTRSTQGTFRIIGFARPPWPTQGS